MGDGPVLLAIRRAALAVYTATGEHPNAVLLDRKTYAELVTDKGDPVRIRGGRHHVAGMVILWAECPGRPKPRRIILPVHAELGDVASAPARPGAAA